MEAGSIFRLDGRVVMITGASSGLGARFAEVSAANGAAVALVGRRAGRLEELASKIKAGGGAAVALMADARKPGDMVSAFDAAETALGTVDVFVANAGTASWGRPSQITPASWRPVMDTNLDAVFWWCQEAARRLAVAGKDGSIVTISSIAGLLVPGGLAAYGITKAAVISATKLLAQEFGSKGIRVNTIAPGWIMSEMTADYLHSEDGIANVKSLPLGRHGMPSDLDGPFLLLASDAGRHMTGTTIVVDGGDLVR